MASRDGRGRASHRVLVIRVAQRLVALGTFAVGDVAHLGPDVAVRGGERDARVCRWGRGEGVGLGRRHHQTPTASTASPARMNQRPPRMATSESPPEVEYELFRLAAFLRIAFLRNAAKRSQEAHLGQGQVEAAQVVPGVVLGQLRHRLRQRAAASDALPEKSRAMPRLNGAGAKSSGSDCHSAGSRATTGVRPARLLVLPRRPPLCRRRTVRFNSAAAPSASRASLSKPTASSGHGQGRRDCSSAQAVSAELPRPHSAGRGRERPPGAAG